MTKKANFKQYDSITAYKESAIDRCIISEGAWQRWQSSYTAIRKKIFLEILETGERGYKQ